jgi:S-adenosylmethionine synthetase
LQLAYAIGVADPVSVHVETHGTSALPNSVIEEHIMKNIDLTPMGIIERLDLRRPIYRQTAAYGHFGKSNLPWEQLDLVDLFKKLA